MACDLVASHCLALAAGGTADVVDAVVEPAVAVV